MGVEMKRMQDKESMTWLTWAIVAAIACWGGLVKYLVDLKQSKAAWSVGGAISQMTISAFAGVIGGMIVHESGFSLVMICATSGVSGSMGYVTIAYFWERITGVKTNAGQ